MPKLLDISTAREPSPDRRCDTDLSRILFSAVAIDGKLQEIVRALKDDERSVLERRRDELQEALQRHSPHEAIAVGTQVSAMLASFRTVRQMGVEIEATVLAITAAIRDFPLWVIAKACVSIGHGEAELDHRFPPNDAEIRTVAKRIMWPYREALRKVEALLAAPVERPASERLTREQIAEKIGRPFVADRPAQVYDDKPPNFGRGNIGGHMQRVLSELAERKRQREVEGASGN